MNQTTDNKTCRQYLTDYFKEYPNPSLQRETLAMLRGLLDFEVPMLGKAGGWAGGIVYAAINRYKRACGITGLLNQECEVFFGVSISTIHKRSWQIRRILGFTSL